MQTNNEQVFTILIPESGGDAGLGAYKLLKDEGYNLVSTDADEYAPSTTHTNFYRVPYATNEEDYMSTFDKIRTRHNVRLVLPTADFDSKTLTSYRLSLLEDSVILAMSHPSVYVEWEDKLAFHKENPNETVATFITLDGAPPFPLFAKPRYGVGSRGLRVIKTKEEFNVLDGEESYVIQPLLDGVQYTVDVLCSLNGQPLQAVTRKVHRLKGGADTVASVVPVPKMEHIAMDICKKYGVIGAACFEFMFNEEGEPKIIDAQPRLSGGHEITALAGLNIPKEIVNLVHGEEFKYKEIQLIDVVRTLQGVRVTNV